MTPTELQQLYLAYFGRPADPGGISYYANLPVSSVVLGFSQSPESQALYGSTFNTASVNAIYNYLFNRPAAAAESQFWVNVVNAPNSTISPASAALSILTSAQNSDSTSITNKLTVATAFTNAINSPAGMAAYSGNTAAASGRGLLSTVNASGTTLSLALIEVNSQLSLVLPGFSTQTTTIKPPGTVTTTPYVPPTQFGYIYLTTGTDTIHAGSGDDFIYGTLGGASTFGPGDVIDGGGGTNTLGLAAVGTGNFSLAGAQITSIQKLSVYAASSTIDATALGGLTELDLTGPGGTIILPSNLNVQLDNTNSYSGGTGNTTSNIYVANAALAGNADSLTLTAKGASYSTVRIATVTPTINEYETLNIVSSQTSSYYGNTNVFTLATDSVQNSLANINISGSAPLTLLLAANDHVTTSATTINASATTGAVTIGKEGDVTLGAANHHIVMGSGGDTVYFGPNLNAGDVVDGGAGFDTVGVSAAVSSAANVHNVEALRFDLTGQSIVQDASAPGLAGMQYVLSGGNTLTLNNLANNAQISVQGTSAGLSGSLQNASGSNDSVTITLGNGSTPSYVAGTTLGLLTGFSGVERLNVAVPGYGTTITNEQTTAPLYISGSGSLTIKNPLQSTLINTSGLTGTITTTLGSSATAYQGGSGSDTIYIGGSSGSAPLAHTIATGGGNDAIIFSTNQSAGNGGATDYSAFPLITDFAVGFDKLEFAFLSGSFKLNAVGFNGGFMGFGGVASVAQNSTLSAASYSPNGYDGISLFKLSTPVAFNGTVAGTFAAAMGTADVSHIMYSSAGSNAMAMVYDSTHGKAVIAVINPTTAGSSVDLTAADFTAAGVSVVGVLNMSAVDYAAFGANNFGYSYT